MSEACLRRVSGDLRRESDWTFARAIAVAVLCVAVLVTPGCSEAPRDPNRIVSADRVDSLVQRLLACIEDQERSGRIDRETQLQAIAASGLLPELEALAARLVPDELQTMRATGVLMQTPSQRAAVQLAALEYAQRNPAYSVESQLQILAVRTRYLGLGSAEACPCDEDIPHFLRKLKP